MIGLQSILDKVVSNLRRQGRVSVNDWDYSCMYRGPNGLKCAAGWLLPDCRYSPKHEKTSVLSHQSDIENDQLPIRAEFEAMGYSQEELRFVRRLQRIHDRAKALQGATLMEFWERRWARLAKLYGLTLPEMKPVENARGLRNVPLVPVAAAE